VGQARLKGLPPLAPGTEPPPLPPDWFDCPVPPDPVPPPPPLGAGSTVTLKLPLVVLLALSVAEQLTDVVPTGKVLPEGGTQVTGSEPSITSVAVAVKVTTAPDGPVAVVVMSAGSVRMGAPLSCTVTLKLPLAGFEPSVAEQLTDVVPSGKVLPEGGTQVTETAPTTISVAEAEKATTAPDGLVAAAVILAGRLKVGVVVSTIVTVKDPLADNPPESVTEQLTVVVPTGKSDPDDGEQVGVGSGLSSTSVAVTLKVTILPPRVFPSSGPILPGRLRVGGVLGEVGVTL